MTLKLLDRSSIRLCKLLDRSSIRLCISLSVQSLLFVVIDIIHNCHVFLIQSMDIQNCHHFFFNRIGFILET
jgi:hypothetical protein